MNFKKWYLNIFCVLPEDFAEKLQYDKMKRAWDYKQAEIFELNKLYGPMPGAIAKLEKDVERLKRDWRNDVKIGEEKCRSLNALLEMSDKETDQLKKQLTIAYELIDWKYNRETNDTCGAEDELAEQWLDENSSYEEVWKPF